jgi:transposase InsO family protein
VNLIHSIVANATTLLPGTSDPFGNEYMTFDEAYMNIKQFIEEVYNSKRLHSSIGYVPPNEFEVKVLNTDVG